MSSTDAAQRQTPVDDLARWFDDRLRLAHGSKKYLRKAFPGHWSFLLGEVTLFSLVVVIFTGIYLSLFYTADLTQVVYDGPYVPLQGQEISAAYNSTLELSFEVRGGLLMRQIHHWGALLFIAAMVVHMLRIFFTGAFRKPREINWVIGVAMLLLAFGAGFTGYSLPDDLLSGTGLRIGYSVLLGIPFVGPLLGFLGLGGEFPGEAVMSRLHIMHVLLIPAGLVGMVSAHLVILLRQKHTQKPGPGRTERNVVGEPFFPSQTMISLSLFALVIAVLSLLGGLFEINPVWLYGVYEPSEVFAPSQPDWYMGWLEGLMRIWPPMNFELFGVYIPTTFIPGVVVPGMIFTIVGAWPWIDAKWVAKDNAEHHLLERPRDNPMRTALGVGGLTALGVIFVGGSNDVIASNTEVGLDSIVLVLQVGFFVLPPITGYIAYRLSRRLKERETAGVAQQAPVATREEAEAAAPA